MAPQRSRASARTGWRLSLPCGFGFELRQAGCRSARLMPGNVPAEARHVSRGNEPEADLGLLRQPSRKLLQPIQPLLDIGKAGGVANAQITIRAKRDSRNRRDFL